jgi:N-acetylglucosaminyldiphosphoundecaprenol N-acetyl-beta-D-mannosaminyltransferase
MTKPNSSPGRTGDHVPQNLARRSVLMGCPVDLLTSTVVLEEVVRTIETQSGPKIIQFVNGNKIAQVRQDPDMERIMWRADYVLADGQPLLPMGRLLGVRVPERIDGIGLMGKLLKLADQRHYSIFLLGAKQTVLETCVQKIQRDYPNVRIAGYQNGYFTEAETEAVVERIRAARCDILFLGMGSPMKERFADRYGKETGASIVQGVGGSFDVMADLVKRAPAWIQQIGCEWLYRVAQEPRRMFWRYATTNATCLSVFGKEFVFHVGRRGQPLGTPESAEHNGRTSIKM